MEQGQWIVVALQLDLLDNRPAVSVRHEITGETLTVNPQRLIEPDLPANRETIYAAGYLQGYADRHFDAVLGGGLSQFVQRIHSSGHRDQARVPGG